MGKIKVLDESVSNIIAAGEVVENPTALLKELIENSLDAGATEIKIAVTNGGRDIEIRDNGSGMEEDDLLLSIERHATSKISKKEDLFKLVTYGFRGEALSSISAVSKMALSSKSESGVKGKKITSLGGKITSLKEIEMDRGTVIEVKELFFNTPARLKFLRKATTEYSNIKELIMLEALVNFNVAFTLIIEDKVSIKTSGKNQENTIVELFNLNVLKNLVKFPYGYLGNSTLSKNSKDSIYVYVNGRVVKSKIIESAVVDSYNTQLAIGKFPFAIIFLNIDPSDVDVNVHPSKKIVKFSNDIYVYQMVKSAILKVIESGDILTSREVTLEKNNNSSGWNIESNNSNNRIESVIEDEDNSSRYRENIEVLEKEKTFSEGIYYQESGITKVGSDPVLKERHLYHLREESVQVKKTQDPLVDFLKYVNQKEEESIKKEEESIKKEDVKISQSELVEITKDKLPYRIIGQFMNTYILAERGDVLELYDQHIVHERILFEEYKERFYNKEIGQQKLLIPVNISLDYRDFDLVMENQELLMEFGVEVEGKNREIQIKSVPLFPFKRDIVTLFYQLVENLRLFRGGDPREEILITMSCKGAIKANELLTIEEMEILLKKLYKYGKFTCPHGRPIILKLTLNEIEKKIQRK